MSYRQGHKELDTTEQVSAMSLGTSSEASVDTKSLQVSSILYTQIASFDNKSYNESLKLSPANLPYFINFLSNSFR